jgi:peptide/nickel transport system ATP-binding protein
MHRTVLQGDLPNPAHPPSGCTFRTRCPLAEQICREQVPEMIEVGREHFAACHMI